MNKLTHTFGFSILLMFSVFAIAAPGDLDPGFGLGGIVLAEFSTDSNLQGFDLVIQSTGKLVAAGRYSDALGDQIFLVRFSSAGVLDPTFGTAGWTVVNFGFPVINAIAAAEQSDGKIVVTGELQDSTNVHFYVARFTADGQVDTQFGNGGITVIDFGVDSASQDVAIAADGKIVIAGNVFRSNEDWALARVDRKGKLDKSFGKRGIVETDFNGFQDAAITVAIQPDQKIVVGGVASTAASYGTMGVARYTEKGELDSSFGNGGKVTTDFGSSNQDFGNSIVLQPDGKIVLGGFAQPLTAVFTFVRYNTNGSIDLSHTEDYIGSDFDAAFGLAINSNGKIILGGGIQPASSDSSFAVACFDGTTGSLDTTFGTGGWAITDVGPSFDGIINIKLQSDNKIVAVGASVQGDGRSLLALARYVGCD